MKPSRMVAYLMGCFAFIASFFVYTEYIHLLGFPAGFITEVEYAERRLAYCFVGVSVLFGLCFMYLCKLALQTRIGRRLSVTIIVYLIAILIVSLIDYSYHIDLMDSTGS